MTMTNFSQINVLRNKIRFESESESTEIKGHGSKELLQVHNDWRVL